MTYESECDIGGHAPRRQALHRGDVVGGHYLIEELLDEGGMAVVYRAKNSATGKRCAVKVLHAQLGKQPEFVRLFAKEAQVGSVIGESEHIVQVFDAGLDQERGLPFIVMELLEGETLEHLLSRGALPLDAVKGLLSQLGHALSQAHAAGVVHRDLKPSNLFITHDVDGGRLLKVMDFGIAKVLEEEALRTATQIGTPAYTAPEQMGSTTRRLAAKQGITIARGISPATDVWAIGLIAYEMLTGQHPGQYWGIETLSELPMKIAFEDMDHASERAGAAAHKLPPGFDEWFARCMHKNADERWRSAGEAVDALCELEDEVIEVAPVRPPALPLGTEVIPTLTRGSGPPLHTVMATPSSARKPASARTPRVKLDSRLPLAATPPPIADPEVERPTTGDPVVAPASSRARGTQWGYAAAAAVLGIGFVALVALPSPERGSASNACTGAGATLTQSQANDCALACNAGSLQSCARFAGALERGIGATHDEVHAARLYARACGVADLGSEPGGASWNKRAQADGCPEQSCFASACSDLARLYEQGRGVAKNAEAATALYKRTCEVAGVERVDGPGDGAHRGHAGCVGLGKLRERAGQRDAAIGYYRAACDGGVAGGCMAVADLLERGDEVGAGRDDKKARALYDQACKNGHLAGCTRLGKMVERGRGGWVKDEKGAIALYKRACDGGELSGCVSLATAYLQGTGGLSPDAVRAAELYTSSCQSGELTACAELAGMVAQGRGGLAKDEKRAFALNKQACDGGGQRGCVQLGKMYLGGDAGLTRDPAEGRRLVERACRAGDAAGCAEVATLGLAGGQIDGDRARSLLSQSCDRGYGEACVKLAGMLEQGSDVAQDLDQAAKLYAQGCDEGAMRGCTELANLVYQGAGGLAKDARRSFALNDKACKGGDAVGCARLGLLYALGQGTTKDKARATSLFRGVCSGKQPSPDMESRCALLKDLVTDGSGG